MRKPANFYKTRYGWIWHRIKGDEARGGLFLHFEAWCGAYLPFSDIDHPFDPKPEFSDMPPGVCRRCEEAALKFGAQPSGLPDDDVPREGSARLAQLPLSEVLRADRGNRNDFCFTPATFWPMHGHRWLL